VKKLTLIIVSIILILNITACTPGTTPSIADPTPEPIVQISAKEVFTPENAQSFAGYTVVTDNISDSEVLYRSEPIGQGDTIAVTVEQYNADIAKDKIRSDYDLAKSMRPSAETLPGIGEDAYIAFPAVHIYADGYHISIAAGSGSDEKQRELLVNIANIVQENLNGLLNK